MQVAFLDLIDSYIKVIGQGTSRPFIHGYRLPGAIAAELHEASRV